MNAGDKIHPPAFKFDPMKSLDLTDILDRGKSRRDQEHVRRWICEEFQAETGDLRIKAPGTLNRHAHILLPPRVYGYVLLDRIWGK